VTSQNLASGVMLTVTAAHTPTARDAAAFDDLYQRAHAGVFGYLCRMARSRPIAEDLFQETWLRVARGWARLPAGADAVAWTYTIARNVFISRRRSQTAESRSLDRLRDLPALPAPGPDRALESARDGAALERAFDALSEEDRTLLWLVGIEEMSQDEAAGVLGIGYAALRQRLSRARGRLAEHLLAARGQRDDHDGHYDKGPAEQP
jgi:RNA polymerase sigma factor (sigma-70 family)